MADHGDKDYLKKPEGTGVLGDDCGHHCGVITTGLTDQKQAHCNCPECHGHTILKSEVNLGVMPGISADGVDPRGIR